MNEVVKPLSPKAKLALSRAELLAAMGFEEAKGSRDGQPALVRAADKQADVVGGRFSRSVVGRWWHRRPLSSVVQLGTPLLQTYASKYPGKLIGYGAGTGVLLYLLKPWRLLSLATVFTLVFRSFDVSGMIAGVMQKAAGGLAKPETSLSRDIEADRNATRHPQ